MSSCLDCDDVALKDFAKYSLDQSHEEREYSEKITKLQNQFIQKGLNLLSGDQETRPRCLRAAERNGVSVRCAWKQSIHLSLLGLYKLTLTKKIPAWVTL